ncbi:MAG: hypothetical protein AAGG79_04225, partial [Pseudomonadota bacterium]
MVGLALIIIALPLAVSPIPVGLVLLVLGIVILVAANPLAALALKALRHRFAWLDKALRSVEGLLPRELSQPLRTTAAGEEPSVPSPGPQPGVGPP